MASKSKKIQKVIDGFRVWNLSSSSNNTRCDVDEFLKSDHFKFGKIVQYGFPNEPTCIAYEPVQKLLAIGTNNGSGRILGRPGVDHSFQQASGAAIIQIIFLHNQGIFITICSDLTIYQWNYQNRPLECVQSLLFKRENLSCASLSPGSKWLYIGTERGNVFFLNIQTFCLSGYVINWNKAIDLSQRDHPGSIVQLGECPIDSNRLLIGFQSGFLSSWDLKEKCAKFRFNFKEKLYGYCWYPDGKNFISCHAGGYLVTWNSRESNTPLSIIQPHNRDNQMDSKIMFFEPIKKVIIMNSKKNEMITVFSGGTPLKVAQKAPSPSSSQDLTGVDNLSSSLQPVPPPSITVMKDKRLTILQMDYPIVDFTQLCDVQFANTSGDPFALVILLHSDLMVIDLLSSNYPSFENPYPIDLHVSPVTCLHFMSDCPGDFEAALYTAKSRQKKPPTNSEALAGGPSAANPYSSNSWPIDGGNCGETMSSNFELIITGHADGSMRFWDATGTNMTSFYKFRLSSFLEKPVITSSQHSKSCAKATVATTTAAANEEVTGNSKSQQANQPNVIYPLDEINLTSTSGSNEPLAITSIKLCIDTKKIMASGRYFTSLLSFTKREVTCDVPVLDNIIEFDIQEEAEVMTEDYTLINNSSSVNNNTSSTSSATGNRYNNGYSSGASPSKNSGSGAPGLTQQTSLGYHNADDKELNVFVGVKSGLIKWAHGYQPDVVCRLASSNQIAPSEICSCAFNANYGLLAYGNDQGIVIVDFVQKITLMSSGTPDLYGSNDPYNRSLWNTSVNKASLSDTQNAADGQCINPSCSVSSTLSPIDSSSSIAPPSSANSNVSSSGYVFEPNKSINSQSSFGSKYSSNQQAAATSANYKAELKRGKSNVSQGFRKFIRRFSLFDRIESGHFSRSTSSSTSSLENMSYERITWLVFGDTFTRKSDMSSTNSSLVRPCLWVGTSYGSILGVNIHLPDLRTSQPVIVNPSGTIFKLRGSIMHIGLLDSNGDLFVPGGTLVATGSGGGSNYTTPNPSMARTGSDTRISSASTESSGGPGLSNNGSVGMSTGGGSIKKVTALMTKQSTITGGGSGFQSSSSNQDVSSCLGNTQNDTASGQDGNSSSIYFQQHHFVVMCSEKSAEVVSMPTQTSISRCKITETSAVIYANVISLTTARYIGNTNSNQSTGSALVLLLANGHLMVYSLPGLRFLMDSDSLAALVIPTNSAAISSPIGQLHHLSVTANGLLIYMSSPSQLDKASISTEYINNIKNVQGELYIPKELPEQPKKSFFESIFTVKQQQLDRDELFGETSSGKASTATATLTQNRQMDKAHAASSNAQSEIAKARMAALERGEKLSEAELKTQEMMDQAKTFSRTASALAAKYEKKDKRWGMPF